MFETVRILFSKGVCGSEEILAIGGTDSWWNDFDSIKPFLLESVFDSCDFFLLKLLLECREFNFMNGLFKGDFIRLEKRFFLIRRILF